MKQIVIHEQEVEELILVMLSRDPVKLHNAINFLQTKRDQAPLAPGPVVNKEEQQQEDLTKEN